MLHYDAIPELNRRTFQSEKQHCSFTYCKYKEKSLKKFCSRKTDILSKVNMSPLQKKPGDTKMSNIL